MRIAGIGLLCLELYHNQLSGSVGSRPSGLRFFGVEICWHKEYPTIKIGHLQFLCLAGLGPIDDSNEQPQASRDGTGVTMEWNKENHGAFRIFFEPPSDRAPKALTKLTMVAKA